jgi:hypothetical protein
MDLHPQFIAGGDGQTMFVVLPLVQYEFLLGKSGLPGGPVKKSRRPKEL